MDTELKTLQEWDETFFDPTYSRGLSTTGYATRLKMAFGEYFWITRNDTSRQSDNAREQVMAQVLDMYDVGTNEFGIRDPSDRRYAYLEEQYQQRVPFLLVVASDPKTGKCVVCGTAVVRKNGVETTITHCERCSAQTARAMRINNPSYLNCSQCGRSIPFREEFRSSPAYCPSCLTTSRPESGGVRIEEVESSTALVPSQDARGHRSLGPSKCQGCYRELKGKENTYCGLCQARSPSCSRCLTCSKTLSGGEKAYCSLCQVRSSNCSRCKTCSKELQGTEKTYCGLCATRSNSSLSSALPSDCKRCTSCDRVLVGKDLLEKDPTSCSMCHGFTSRPACYNCGLNENDCPCPKCYVCGSKLSDPEHVSRCEQYRESLRQEKEAREAAELKRGEDAKCGLCRGDTLNPRSDTSCALCQTRYAEASRRAAHKRRSGGGGHSSEHTSSHHESSSTAHGSDSSRGSHESEHHADSSSRPFPFGAKKKKKSGFHSNESLNAPGHTGSHRSSLRAHPYDGGYPGRGVRVPLPQASSTKGHEKIAIVSVPVSAYFVLKDDAKRFLRDADYGTVVSVQGELFSLDGDGEIQPVPAEVLPTAPVLQMRSMAMDGCLLGVPNLNIPIVCHLFENVEDATNKMNQHTDKIHGQVIVQTRRSLFILDNPGSGFHLTESVEIPPSIPIRNIQLSRDNLNLSFR